MSEEGRESSYLAASLPAPETPWRRAEFAAIDLELTGLDPARDEIVSFATVTVAEGRIRLADAIHRLVRPERMPDAETIRIHGLRRADLESAPPLHEVLDGLLETIAGRVLVAHVAAVERTFLGAALATRGLTLRNPVLDTAALGGALASARHRARPLHRRLLRRPRPLPRSLGELARALGLPVHRPHHADGDALTTAQVFLALATLLEAFGPVTVGSLLREGGELG